MAFPAEELRYSFADALAWDESDRAEIIDGEIILMAPPPLREHQDISVEIATQLRVFLRGKQCKVYPAPFAVRPFEQDGDRPEDVDTMVEPDITVVCDPAKLDKYGCKGAPDLVIEILSPSTRTHDLRVKYRLYQKAGVREYWIVDPKNKTVQVFTLDDHGYYGAAEVYTAEMKVPVSLWDDFSIDLAGVFPE